MRVTLGDMEYEDKATTWSGGTSYEVTRLNAQENDDLKERLAAFLTVAERCYIERHGLKPERTTRDEF